MQIATRVTHWWEMTFGVAGLAYAAHQGWLGDAAGRWIRRFDLRIPYVALGLFFHVGLWVSVNIGTFSAVTLAFYVAFLSPQEWSRLARRVGATGGAIK